MRPARYFEVSILVTMVLIRGGAGTVLGLVLGRHHGCGCGLLRLGGGGVWLERRVSIL